jgi:hypothetical protein
MIPVTEKQFQSQVVELAKTLRWSVYHTFDSRHSTAGYPDLTLVRERIIFAELKVGRGKLSPAQIEWRDLLVNAGASWCLWRPADWDAIVHTLR